MHRLRAPRLLLRAARWNLKERFPPQHRFLSPHTPRASPFSETAAGVAWRKAEEALPPCRVPVPAELVLLRKLVLGLQTERATDFEDLKGESGRLSQVLFKELSLLMEKPPPWVPPDAALGNVAFDFHQYLTFDKLRRQAAVRAGEATLAKLLAAYEANEAAASSRAAAGYREVDTGGQGSQAWLRARDVLLTGSQFADALCIPSFGSTGDARRLQLWEQRLGLRPPVQVNAFMRWGTATEPIALERYRAVTGNATEACNLGVLLEPQEPEWLGASPDGLIVSQPGLIEIKCPGGGRSSAEPYESIPPYYVPQMMGQMAVFDRRFCDLFAFTPRRSALWTLDFDAALWRQMIVILRHFWFQNVLPARAAKAQGASEAELRALYAPKTDVAAQRSIEAGCLAIAQRVQRRVYDAPNADTAAALAR